MKKQICTLLAVMVLAFSLCACAQSGSPVTDESSSQTGGTSQTVPQKEPENFTVQEEEQETASSSVSQEKAPSSQSEETPRETDEKEYSFQADDYTIYYEVVARD